MPTPYSKFFRNYFLGFSSCLIFSSYIYASGTGDQPTRFRVTNQCAEEIWVQQDFKRFTDKNQIVVKIPSGKSHDYNIPDDGLPATRFWAKSGCNEHGYNCRIGESTAVPEAEANKWQSAPYAPDINSKFEATWGCISGNCAANPSDPGGSLGQETWWNGSAVDGYTFPYQVVVKDHQNSCRDIHSGRVVADPGVYCGDLKPEACPSSANLSTEGKFNQVNGKDLTNVNLQWKDDSGKPIGCFSPCAKLTTAQGNTYSDNSGGWKYYLGGLEPDSPSAQMYCCPTPPISNQECIDGPAGRSDYAESVSVNQACNSYTYAYDDAKGLARCGGQTKFELVFCPSKQQEPVIAEIDMSFAVQEQNVSPKYNDELIVPDRNYKVTNGGIVSITKSGDTYSCPLIVSSDTTQVDANNLPLVNVSVAQGSLCDKLQIDVSKKIITILQSTNPVPNPDPTPTPDGGYKFIINYPGVQNIKAYLNNNEVPRVNTWTSASSVMKISSLRAEQDGRVGNCNIIFDEKEVRKGGFGEFCNRIVLLRNNNGDYFINLPADVPNSENKPIPVPDDDPAPNPTADFTFQINYNPGNVIAYLNETKIENAVKNDASQFPSNSFITALQNENIGICNLVIDTNEVNIVKGGSELCKRINVVKESKNIHLYLPASIPNTAEVSPPSPEPTPDPEPNPDPGPTPAPVDPSVPPQVLAGDKYASFGIAAGIEATFGGYKVANGTKVAIKDMNGSDIQLIAKQGSNTVGCTLKKSGDNLSIDMNSGFLCARGLVVQRHGDGNYYIGLPNPLPAK